MCSVRPGEGCISSSRKPECMFGGIYNLVGMTTATYTIQIQSRVMLLPLRSLWAFRQRSNMLTVVFKNQFGKLQDEETNRIRPGVHCSCVQLALPASLTFFWHASSPELRPSSCGICLLPHTLCQNQEPACPVFVTTTSLETRVSALSLTSLGGQVSSAYLPSE